MKGFRWICKVSKDKDGHIILRIPPDKREWYNKVVDYCIEKRQGNVDFNVAPPRRKRSTGKNSQNTKINGDLQQISIESGQPFGDVKEYCKSRAIDMGYPILKDDKGNTILNMWGKSRGISESDATIEDAKILIEQIIQVAAEMDIRLRDEA